jgi:hypothetical protein
VATGSAVVATGVVFFAPSAGGLIAKKPVKSASETKIIKNRFI